MGIIKLNSSLFVLKEVGQKLMLKFEGVKSFENGLKRQGW